VSRGDDIQVTAAEAAREVGVKRATIDTWVHRGYLAAVDPTARPRRYWLSDVFAAEATRDDRMRRPPAMLAKDSDP
jgi:predicted site-specific integrase-resolvase